MELKRLSEIFAITPDPKSEGRYKDCEGFYTHWCTYKVISYHLSHPDSVVLVHGPQGCTGNERTFLISYISQYHGAPFRFTPVTDMNVSDTVLGAEEKLRAAILEVDRIYRPKMIYILVTCCAGVIREPVEDIADDMKDSVEAELMVLRAEGFTHYFAGKSNIYLSEMLSNLFEEPKRKIPRSINILGMAKEVHYARGNFPEESSELERLVNKFGVTVNSVLLQSVPIEAFKKAPEAEFNTFVCPQWGYPMAKTMQDRFGIPYGKGFNPLGVAAISKWLMEVGEFFGLAKEAKKVIDEEYAQIKDIWEAAKRIVEGKIVLQDGGDPMSSVGRNIAWGRMVKDLGMEPIIFNIPSLEVKGKFHHVAFALEDGFDPLIVHTDMYAYHRRLSPIEIIEGLGLNPEDVILYIGDVFPRAIADEWDIPVFDPSNFARVTTAIHCNKNRSAPGRRGGFRGAERFARDVINAIRMAKRKDIPTLLGRLKGE